MKTSRLLQALCLPLVFCFPFTHSNAALFNVSGSWDASEIINIGLSASPDPFAGSFSFQFDDSTITGTGTERIDDITLELLTLTPSTIGTTPHGLSNSRGFVEFQDGSLTFFGVGGIINGAITIAVFTDDYQVIYNSLGELFRVTLSNQDKGRLFWARNTNGTGDLSVVPIPAAFWLFGAGLVGLIGFSKRNKAA